jgi:hypothetical protein
MCGRWYQLRAGSMLQIVIDDTHAPLICFLCVRTLKKLGFINNTVLVKQEENTKRVVEI